MTDTTAHTKVTCYHCGDPVHPSEALMADDHPFCCTGCQSVYQLLQQANLCEFYNLEERTGKVSAADRRKYLPLDNEEIARSFLEFEHEGLARVTFFAPAIHCSSCIWLLEHLQRLHTGVVRSLVNFPRREVTISYYTDRISLREVAELLDAVGYPPMLERKRTSKKADHSLVMRLAVAGFCFGNSMLLSLPDYLDLGYQIPENYRSIFAYINLLFSLPVFFYSATVYFQSAWKSLRHRFVNIDVPISLGILTLFLRSLYEIVVLGHLGYVDSLAGLVFFLLIGRWYQHKAYQALSFDREVAAYFPMAVTRLLEGREVTTRLQELKEGDEVLLRHQELIPADGFLVSGEANIDYSFVTGEALPSPQPEGALLYAGGRQLGGPITIRLAKKVNNSHLTKLWNQQAEGVDFPGLQNLSDRISRYFTAVLLFIAVGGSVVWFFIDASKAFQVFSAVLIVACPCASALAVPFTYGHMLRLFGRNGLYLKNANRVEKLATVKHLIFDKTGTLTRPLPEQVVYEGRRLTPDEKREIYSIVANSVHPLSKLLTIHLAGADRLPLNHFSETVGRGIGAGILANNWKIGSAEWVSAPTINTEGTAQVWVAKNGEVLGVFRFESAYRPGIFEVLQTLKNSFGLTLLSGDGAREKSRLSPYFGALHFRQTPQHKREQVEHLTTKQPTLMVGDGLNDAGALKTATVGISLSDDIYQFSPASDGILNAAQIQLLPRFLQLSRSAVRIVVVALVVSLLYNLVGLTFALMGLLSPMICAVLMPISSVTVVGLITLMVRWRGRGLGSL